MTRTEEALAYWVIGAGRGELRREPLPAPASGEITVQTLYSGVSRGTESLVFNGRVPESEHQRMRAPFQRGDFPFPVKYGYANVGQVVDGSPELAGKTVFSLYPHQDRYNVPVTAVHEIPPSVPASRAVLAANLETALNGVWDAGVRPGDRVTVVGAGTVGCLVAWLVARIPGCTVELVDINAGRSAIAAALGAAFSQPATARVGTDIVFHASGSAPGLQLAVNVAGFEATIVELSWYGAGTVVLSLGGAFHSQRLTLKSSQVGAVADAQRARWTFRRRMELALSLLSDPALDVLINSTSHFQDLPETMRRLASAPGDVIMHRVAYESVRGR